MQKDEEQKCEEHFKEKFEKKFGKDWKKKMENKFDKWGNSGNCHCQSNSGFMGGGFYFLAFIGAAVYYCQQTPDFWWKVVGILKGCIWPAMLIHKVFTMINM